MPDTRNARYCFPMQLTLLAGRFAVCRLAAEAAVPPWAWHGDLAAVTRTPEELSIVCEETTVPAEVQAERGWAALRVAGSLDFSLTGILARLTQPLAEAGVSVFALSTYDTDYLLVRAADLPQAVAAWKAAGHLVA